MVLLHGFIKKSQQTPLAEIRIAKQRMIAEEMKGQNMTKTSLAEKMRTSRASLNRLLDENDASLTLTTLTSAAAALGKKIKIELVPA